MSAPSTNSKQQKEPLTMSQFNTAAIDRSALQHFCRVHNVTPTRMLAAAWAVTLHIYRYSEITEFRVKHLPVESVEVCKQEVRPSSTLWDILDLNGDSTSSEPSVDSHISTELRISEDDIVVTTDSSLSSYQAASMTRTFSIALATLRKSPMRPIEEFDLCSESDREQIREWTKYISPSSRTSIPRMVSHQASLTPTAVAIEAHDGIMTYAELERATSSLAQYLIAKRVSPGSCILLYFRRSLWAYVSMLAVMKAGCCYAAVDAIYSVEHVVDTVRAAEITVALTDVTHSIELASAYDLVVPISQPFVASLPEITTSLRSVDPNDICFVIFTSGSSGKRKGIKQQHSTFCTSLLDFGRILSIGPGTRILCSEDLSFAIANAEIFAAWAFGATACVPSDEMMNTGYVTAITEMQATLFLNSPTSIALLNPSDVPTLRTVCSLGEPLSKEVIRRWAPAVRLGNIYGMSECSIWVGFLDHIDFETITVPIGRVPTGAIYLVHPSNSQVLVPVGAVGTIVFEGPIANGYLDRSSDYQCDFLDPTPEWLSTLHAKNRPVGKLYRSGDLGRCNPDGTIEYLGRKNRTLKLDGNFVNVEDIEALARPCIGSDDLVAIEVVQSVPQIPCFAVFLQSPDARDQQQYCNITDCANPEVVKKLEAIKQRLLEFPSTRAIPRMLYSVVKMPRTPTGKIDRRLLRQAAGTPGCSFSS